MTAAEEREPLVRYLTGDATRPEGPGTKVIAHCCNDAGLWGAGFVMALSDRWKRPEREYLRWHRESPEGLLLGAMQLVPVEDDVMVANIVGQHGIRRGPDGTPPIRYDAIAQGFGYISTYAAVNHDRNVSVHMPRIGCSLAGGSWARIEPLIDLEFVSRGIPVTVYDWPGGKFNP